MNGLRADYQIRNAGKCAVFTLSTLFGYHLHAQSVMSQNTVGFSSGRMHALPEVVSGEFQYTVTSNAATIINYTGQAIFLSIPERLDNLPVVAIGQNISLPVEVTGFEMTSGPFSECTNLVSVNLPGSIRSLDGGAFANCVNLTTIKMQEGVRRIGIGAFSGCSKLKTLTIPDSVTEIGVCAFSDCQSLTAITLPRGLTCLSPSVFQSCTALSEVTIPAGVTSIGESAFYGCIKLTSITIPASVRGIGDAFSGCTSLTAFTVDASNTSYSSKDGLLYDKPKTTLIACPEGRVAGFTIPASVSNLADKALSGARLTTIAVDAANATYSSRDGVLFDKRQTEIIIYPQGRVGSCTIPDSVTDMNLTAFRGCTGLTAFCVNPANPNYSSKDGMLLNKHQTELVEYPHGRTGSCTIPDGIKVIGISAFGGCSGLTGVTIPASVIRIGWGAFQGCTGLTDITIPESVMRIDHCAFSHCKGLTNINCRSVIPAFTADDSILAGCNETLIHRLTGKTGAGTRNGARPLTPLRAETAR